MHIDHSVNLLVRGMVVNKDKHGTRGNSLKFLACLHILMPTQILYELIYLSLVLYADSCLSPY